MVKDLQVDEKPLPDEKPIIIKSPDDNQSIKKISILDDLMNNLEDLEAEELKDKFIEISSESIPILWKEYIDSIAQTAHASYLPIAQNSNPIFEKDNTLIFTEDNSISLGFMEKNKAEIQLFFREKTGISLQLKFELKKTSTDNKKKISKKPNELFKEWAEINPALIELQKRLDLNIEY